jgi:hypothetical protein
MGEDGDSNAIARMVQKGSFEEIATQFREAKLEGVRL